MLKPHYFGHLMRMVTHWKVPDTGKDCGQKKRASEDEMAGWHHHCNLNMNLGKLQETVRDREAWHAAVHRVAKS